MILLSLLAFFSFLPNIQSKGKDVLEIATIIEDEFSKYKCEKLYALNVQDKNLLIFVSNIKHILTYSSRTLNRTGMYYEDLTIYYRFTLEVFIKEKKDCIKGISKTIQMKQQLNYLYITQNELGIHSERYPSSINLHYVKYDGKLDLNEYDLFKEYLKDMHLMLTPYLFDSFKTAIKNTLKANLQTSYDFLFQKFINIISNKYHKVEKKNPYEDRPDYVQFRGIKYAFVQQETHYCAIYMKVKLEVDFYFDGAEYSPIVSINYISFGLYGISFGEISAVKLNEFLRDIIPEIFKTIFDQIDFRAIIDELMS